MIKKTHTLKTDIVNFNVQLVDLAKLCQKIVVLILHDNLTRQITESFYIFKTEQQTDFELINAKSEWNAPTLYTVYPIPRGLGQEALE